MPNVNKLTALPFCRDLAIVMPWPASLCAKHDTVLHGHPQACDWFKNTGTTQSLVFRLHSHSTMEAGLWVQKQTFEQII